VRLASGAKFAVLSFLCVMVFALSMGFALSSLLTRAVQEWEWENTAALTRREIELRGLDTVLAAPRSAPLDERTREQQLSSLMRGLPEVVRVKVWDRDATVVWSDEPRLIGQRFADDNELKEALAGEVTVEIKTLDGREHAYERPRFTTLAEVHVPRRHDDAHAALTEHPLDAVAARVCGAVAVQRRAEREPNAVGVR